MIVAYLRTLPTNRFDVYTRLIYKGKILISALKINHILPVIKDFEEKYACKNEASFDNLPSADVGEEYEINLIKEMFSKEELDEMMKR